jgi:bacterioferritin
MSRATLIERLNEDLARELGTIIRYNYQAARVEGPVGSPLRQLLRDEAAEELSHAAFLTDAIVDLGGEPTTTPDTFEKPASITAMLEIDLAMEQTDVARYMAHSALAAMLGEIELELKLEELAAGELGHALAIQQLLSRV